MNFFIVHISCTIRGSRYIPGVVYPITDGIREVVTDMAKKNTATLFAEEVRMVSGIPHPVKRDARRGQAGKSVSAPSPFAGSVPPAPVWHRGERTPKTGMTSLLGKAAPNGVVGDLNIVTDAPNSIADEVAAVT